MSGGCAILHGRLGCTPAGIMIDGAIGNTNFNRNETCTISPGLPRLPGNTPQPPQMEGKHYTTLAKL